nr:hypothetical protein BJQ95_02249 [Cryobacterium sp. SO1]
MESAPATIPATSEATFRPAFAPLSVGTLNHLSARRRRPAFSASFIAGTKPAEDTRLESSKDADTARVVCETCIYEMPF